MKAVIELFKSWLTSENDLYKLLALLLILLAILLLSSIVSAIAKPFKRRSLEKKLRRE